MFPVKSKPKHRFLYNFTHWKKTYPCTQKTSYQVLWVHLPGNVHQSIPTNEDNGNLSREGFHSQNEIKYKVKLEYWRGLEGMLNQQEFFHGWGGYRYFLKHHITHFNAIQQKNYTIKLLAHPKHSIATWLPLKINTLIFLYILPFPWEITYQVYPQEKELRQNKKKRIKCSSLKWNLWTGLLKIIIFDINYFLQPVHYFIT